MADLAPSEPKASLWTRVADRTAALMPSIGSDKEGDVEVYSRQLTIRIAQGIAVVMAIAMVILWPTDFFAFRGQPQKIIDLAYIRATGTLIGIVALFVTEWIYRRALHLYWVVSVIFVLTIVVMPFSFFGEWLADTSMPYFYTIYAVAPITILLIYPFWLRALTAAALFYAWLAVQMIFFPQSISSEVQWSIFVFGTFEGVCSVLIGHGFTTLVRSNYQREQQLRRERQRVAEANDQLSRLFANVSHEMRTPLTVIRGNLQRISQRIEADAELARWMNGLDRNTARLSILVDQFLSMSRRGAAPQETSPQRVNVVSATKAVIDAVYTGVALEHQPKLTAVPSKLEAFVDPNHLADMLFNLISNARKFSDVHQGGQGRVEIHCTQHAGSVQVRVSDDGPGVPDNGADVLFDRFTQLHDENSLQLGGVGLGLSIVNELAKLNGGHVELLADQHAGASFLLSLPSSEQQELGLRLTASPPPSKAGGLELAEAPTLQKEAPGVGAEGAVRAVEAKLRRFAIASGSQGRRVEALRAAVAREEGASVAEVAREEGASVAELAREGYASVVEFRRDEGASVAHPQRPVVFVVDDEEDMLEHVVDTLSDEPVRVFAFSSAVRALEAIDRLKPALVISDLMMRPMDGAAFVDHLRSTPAWTRLPVIVVSADHDPISRVNLLERGAVDFMTKPFHSEELIARVRRHLDVSRWAEQLSETVENLEATRTRLQALESSWKEGGEDEQEAFAQELAQVLHDDLGQLIASCSIELGLAEYADSMPQATESLRRLRQSIAALSDTFRDTLSALSRSVLPDVSLAHARRSLFLLRNYCDVQASDRLFEQIASLPEAHSSCLIRSLQELFTNVLRHASPSTVKVRLNINKVSVRLTVTDDGKGMSPEVLAAIQAEETSARSADGHEMGLSGIRRRVRALRGAMHVLSASGAGTTVTVTLPISLSNDRAQTN